MRFHALFLRSFWRNLQCMTRRPLSNLPALSTIWGLLLFVALPECAVAEPPAAAVSAFNTYTAGVELHLAQQHRSTDAFLAPQSSAGGKQEIARLRRGDLIVEQLTSSADADLPGAMLHHWRATAFAPGAKAGDFERLMKNFNAYPQYFSPEVMQARVSVQHGDHFQVWMRVRQKHVITVVMDSIYDVAFQRPDARHGYSISKSTQISEIDSPGTKSERALSPSEEHGFLWRLNTYWTYEERDGGLYMQIETVSLSRSIPTGLGWAVRPFVESVPRESMEFTLRSTCNALRK
jgi:hypothetical protein